MTFTATRGMSLCCRTRQYSNYHQSDEGHLLIVLFAHESCHSESPPPPDPGDPASMAKPPICRPDLAPLSHSRHGHAPAPAWNAPPQTPPVSQLRRQHVHVNRKADDFDQLSRIFGSFFCIDRSPGHDKGYKKSGYASSACLKTGLFRTDYLSRMWALEFVWISKMSPHNFLHFSSCISQLS